MTDREEDAAKEGDGELLLWVLGDTLRVWAGVALLFFWAGCSSPTICALSVREEAVVLTEKGWSPKNRAALELFLREERKNPARKVAVFDWDNTVIKNDVGDAFFFSLLERGISESSQQGLLRSPFLTPAARRVIEKGPLVAELISIYRTGRLLSGEEAFAGADERIMEPAYALLAHLLAGMTPDAVRLLAAEVIAAGESCPVDSVRAVGAVSLPASLRIYPAMQELIEKLQEVGFEIWVVSATPQPVVETYAARLGIPRERVIGIRNIEKAGRLTGDLHGCGPVGDGENRLITYRDGKRCWIDTAIFGTTVEDPFAPNPHPAMRPRFAAGDSDGDISFLSDATGLRLVLDRGKPLVTQAASRNEDGRWIVQKPFLLP